VLAAAQRREALRERAEQLEVAAGAARAALAEALAAWQRAQQRLRAVVTLHERHRAELAAQDARREQRLTDELAGALAARGGDQP
jgi:flagellar export protein FliJ